MELNQEDPEAGVEYPGELIFELVYFETGNLRRTMTQVGRCLDSGPRVGIDNKRYKYIGRE